MDEFFRQMKEREEMMRRLAEGPAAEFLRNEEMMRRLAEGPAAEFLRNQESLPRVTDIARTIDTHAMNPVLGRLLTPEFATALVTAARQASESLDGLRTPQFMLSVERASVLQAEMHEFVGAALLAHRKIAGQIHSMAFQMDATLMALPTIDFEQLGSLLAIAESPRATLGLATEKLVFRHTRLVESLTLAHEASGGLPSPITVLPTQGLFVHTGAVRSITPHQSLPKADQEISVSIRLEISTTTAGFLEETLPALHAPFLDQYRAARLRAVDRGPDWWTQGSASMRKLLKGVLHRTAPNELVVSWAQANKKSLDSQGRPTRATKVAWLCQFIPNDDYRRYVHAELDSALALIDIIDVAQHVDEFPDFENKYNWVFLRVEVAVRLMLELWNMRSAH